MRARWSSLGISVPLFDAGTISRHIKKAGLDRDLARRNLSIQVSSLAGEIQTAAAHLRAVQAQAEGWRTETEELHRLADLADRGAALGQGDPLLPHMLRVYQAEAEPRSPGGRHGHREGLAGLSDGPGPGGGARLVGGNSSGADPRHGAAEKADDPPRAHNGSDESSGDGCRAPDGWRDYGGLPPAGAGTGRTFLSLGLLPSIRDGAPPPFPPGGNVRLIWEYFELHGLGGVLGEAAPRIADLPPPLAEAAQHRYWSNSLKGEQGRRCCATIVETGQREGLPVFFVKGPAIAEVGYEDYGLRGFSDLDIFTASADSARHLVRACGAGFRTMPRHGAFRARFGIGAAGG